MTFISLSDFQFIAQTEFFVETRLNKERRRERDDIQRLSFESFTTYTASIYNLKSQDRRSTFGS